MKVVALHTDETEHTEASERFDEFWDVFPKKQGKAKAKAKWDAITNGGLETKTRDSDSGTYVDIFLKATAEEIIAGAKRYRDRQIDKQTYKLRDNGRYTCMPANWLNQGRWEDE